MVRIRWTRALESSLESLHHLVRGITGKWVELAKIWNRKYPHLQTTSCALRVKYSRLASAAQRRMTGAASTDESDQDTSFSDDSSSDEEWEEPRLDGDSEDDEQALGRSEILRTRPIPPVFVVEEVTIEFLAVFDKVSDGAVGDFKGRVTPSVRGKNVNPSLLQLVDELVGLQLSEPSSDLWTLNCAVYAAALLIERMVVFYFTKLKQRKPGGLSRQLETLLTRINKTRCDIGRLGRETKRRRGSGGKSSKAKLRHNKMWVLRRFGKINRCQLQSLLADARDQLQIQKRRKKDLQRRLAAHNQNRAYDWKGPKQVMRAAALSGPTTVTPPPTEDVAKFWNSILGVTGEWDKHNRNVASWGAEVSTHAWGDWEDPTEELFEEITKMVPGWRAPGRDMISGFWWKSLPSARKALFKLAVPIVRGEQQMPQWFVWGRTILIPKDGCTGEPSQYRPIACLNIGYKIITKVIARMIEPYVVGKLILPEEQRAARKGQRGCADALWLDFVIAQEKVDFQGNLAVAWVDYAKAYDRVPHGWIRFVLRTIGIPKQLRRCIRGMLKLWKSDFVIRQGQAVRETTIVYQRGLLQGDSLSPLMFCLCIAPLSWALRRRAGVVSARLGIKITHTLFMDDLKVYASSEGSLRRTLRKVVRVSTAMGMQLNIKKCATASMVGGVPMHTGLLKISGEIFPRADQEDPYKYLGILQVLQPLARDTQERLRKTYCERLNTIWKSSLSARKKVTLTNSYASSVFRYYFAFLPWSKTILQKLDRFARRAMVTNKCHHEVAAIQRVHLPRAKGGRGVTSVVSIWEQEVVSTALYLMGAKHYVMPEICGVLRSSSGGSTIFSQATAIVEKYCTNQTLGVTEVVSSISQVGVSKASALMGLRSGQWEQLLEKLRGKRIHSAHRKTLEDRKSTDIKGSLLWYKSFPGSGETEGFIFAAQDGVLFTRAFLQEVRGEGDSNLCRKCGEGRETIGHILSSCSAYNWSLYKERHDKILYQVVRTIAAKYSITLPQELHWNGGNWTGSGVVANGWLQLQVDRLIQSDVRVPNRPDLVVRNSHSQTVTIADVACTWEPSLAERQCEKVGKYEPLARAMGRAKCNKEWSVRTCALVVGDLGTVGTFRKSIRDLKLFDENEIDCLTVNCQYEALFYAVRILRGHLAS